MIFTRNAKGDVRESFRRETAGRVEPRARIAPCRDGCRARHGDRRFPSRRRAEQVVRAGLDPPPQHVVQEHHSAIVLRVHRPPLHEFLERRRRAVDLDGLAGFRAAHRAMLVHVDDERVDRVSVQDEMREGVALGLGELGGRHGYLEGLVADVAR